MPLFRPNIAALKDKHDIGGLVQALQYKDAQVRDQAAQALGELGDKRAIKPIADLLTIDDNQIGEKVAAADALGRMGDTAAIAALVKANEISRQRETKMIDDVHASKDRPYRFELYINRISTDEYTLRTAIARALGQIGGVRAIQNLFDLLATEKGAMESGVKSAIKDAILEAVRKGDSAIVPLLCDELKQTAIDVRHCAARCLGEIESGQAEDALIRTAYDEAEHFSVREAAIASLGKIGSEKAIPFLEDLMHNQNHGLARDAKQCAAAIRARYPFRPLE